MTTHQDEPLSCPDCQGTGQQWLECACVSLRSAGQENCPDCEGRGVVENPATGNDQNCPRCQGTGGVCCRDCQRPGRVSVRCEACGGAGHRLPPPPVESVEHDHSAAKPVAPAEQTAREAAQAIAGEQARTARKARAALQETESCRRMAASLAEIRRQDSVRMERRSRGECIMCGERLSPLARLLRASTHRRCAEYRD